VNKLLNDLWKLRIAKTEAADIQKKWWWRMVLRCSSIYDWLLHRKKIRKNVLILTKNWNLISVWIMFAKVFSLNWKLGWFRHNRCTDTIDVTVLGSFRKDGLAGVYTWDISWTNVAALGWHPTSQTVDGKRLLRSFIVCTLQTLSNCANVWLWWGDHFRSFHCTFVYCLM
jgi:hypothetical protein